ncbi:MAG TPA: P-loop NTPase fold protein [Polyangiaceae bacterium]
MSEPQSRAEGEPAEVVIHDTPTTGPTRARKKATKRSQPARENVAPPPGLAVVRRDDSSAAMAFLIAPNYALTLGHVVSQAPSVTLLFAGSTRREAVEARVEFSDRVFDYALLRLAQPVELPPLELEAQHADGAECVVPFFNLTAPDMPALQMSGRLTAPRVEPLPAGAPGIVGVGLPLARLERSSGDAPASGRSGAPVLVNGKVTAIFGYARQAEPDASPPQASGLLALPISLVLADARIRRQLDPGMLESASTDTWVAVAGGSDRRSGNEMGNAFELARHLGRAIAERGLGLVTGGFGGVDEAVGLGHTLGGVVGLMPPNPLRVVLDGYRPMPLFERAIQLHVQGRNDDWAKATVADASLVILLDGGWSLEQLARRASEANKPVLPLPTSDGVARKLHASILEAWDARPVPGLTREEFASLVDADEDKKLALTRKVLDAIQVGQAAAQPLALGFPTLGNDAARGEDLLDLGQQARTFARAIVSRNLTPPLAIGLFGDWGAGKSHFMHLIRAHAEKESDTASKAAAGTSESWPHICQIEFNAWHYMDADLWSSLAGRIFDELADWLDTHAPADAPKPATDYATTRRRLRERLRSTLDAKEDAVANARHAVDRLAELRMSIEQLKSERDARLSNIETLKRSDVEALWREISPHVSIHNAREAAKKLGLAPVERNIDTALKAPEQVSALAAQLQTTHGQVHALLHSLSPDNALVWVLGAVIAAGPSIVQLLAQDPALKVALADTSTTVAQVAALATTVGVQIKAQLGRVSQFVEYANAVREKGEQLKERLLARLPEEEQHLVREYQEAQAQLEATLARKADLERELVETQQRLDALQAGKLVYDFVSARTGQNAVYRSREGIVSIVRRDLETLSDLLRQWRAPDPDKPQKQGFTELDTEAQEDFPIQRIVLYIDDLDRCPPKRVVEVLQAVHLLLAFDLFVVIVGVDARWLERSLEHDYQDLIGTNTRQSEGANHRTVTPQDYLEKIFQVPFTLPRVQPDGFRKLLQEELHLLSELGPTPKPARSLDLGAASAAALAPPFTGAPNAEPAGTQQVDASTRPAQAASTKSGDATQPEPAAAANAQKPPAPVAMFHLEPWERDFMTERLSEFISTPRLIKRFANVYRLLRADVAPHKYHEFSRNDARGGHRAVQILLATIVGFPRVGCDVLRLLAWPDLVNLNVERGSWSEFLMLIDPAGNDFARVSPQLTSVAADGVGFQRLHQLLLPFRQITPPKLEVWSEWAAQVGRYSMYWVGRG